VIDTSVFVSIEQGRSLRHQLIPEVGAISIVTKAELRAGVLAAKDIATRDRRLDTLDAVAGIVVLPVDEKVARAWAQMRAYLAAAEQRVNVNDMWIAATAAAHDIPVLTQDGDFDALSGVAGLTVIPI
jgi:predicted nucleic acid-binding protein